MPNLAEQFKRNQLAILSLVVALIALGYNTWRNEVTELNRNMREAGFEMIVIASELRQIAYLAHYDKDTVAGNPRKGWAKVLVLQDLAQLMPEDVQASSQDLLDAWQAGWSSLGEEQASVDAIDTAIDDLRTEVLECLAELD